MAKTTLLSISTPTGKVFKDDVAQVNVDISEGRIGVLAKHSPLVSSLKTSTFNIRYEDGRVLHGVVAGGIFNVTGTEVTILTTDFLFSDEVDITRCEKDIAKMKYMLEADLQSEEEKGLKDRLKYEELKLELAK